MPVGYQLVLVLVIVLALALVPGGSEQEHEQEHHATKLGGQGRLQFRVGGFVVTSSGGMRGIPSA